MRKLITSLIIIAFIFTITGSCLAKEKKEKTEFQVTTEKTVEAIRSKPLNIGDLIGNQINVFGEWFLKFIKSGNPIIIAESFKRQWTGVDGIVFDGEKKGYPFNVISGYVTDFKQGGWFWGIKLNKEIPVLKNVQFLNNIKPALAIYKGNFYLSFDYDWREE